MTEEVNQELRVEKLVSGDRPSIYALGIFGAESIKRSQMAIFMVDVLGRVCIMPPDSVQVLRKPRIADVELDLLSEEDAINTMLQQEDDQTAIIKYLKAREVREHG